MDFVQGTWIVTLAHAVQLYSLRQGSYNMKFGEGRSCTGMMGCLSSKLELMVCSKKMPVLC